MTVIFVLFFLFSFFIDFYSSTMAIFIERLYTDCVLYYIVLCCIMAALCEPIPDHSSSLVALSLFSHLLPIWSSAVHAEATNGK